MEATNDAGPAAFLFFADLLLEDGTRLRLESDASWLASPRASEGWMEPGAETSDWRPAREIAPYGSPPWGEVGRSAEPRFDPPAGFRVETAAEGLGSLLALAFEPGGGLLVSAEGAGILRLADRDRDGAYESVETVSDRIDACQGLCVSKGTLHAVGVVDGAHGLHRIDAAGVPALVGRFAGGGGEHGAHGVVEGPDGALLVVVGNHATIESPWSPASPYRIHYEGNLLPRLLDPRGHALRVRSPGGVVARVDPETREWRVLAGGLRNAYDLAIDGRGEIFTFDSDMEWDAGLPWYRAVRLIHVVPGGEYGSRTGSSVWPDTHADALPPVVETGRGSPTGLCFWTGERVPARLRGALLAGDWSLGQILAFRLEARGASYGATVETLLRGRPLNVTDLVADRDGSILFCTGGRGTEGGVYRLVYEGAVESAPDPPRIAPTPRFSDSSPTPRLLEALSSADRWVRFLAARELERREAPGWEETALALPDPRARAEALVALARIGFAREDSAAVARGIAAARALVGAEGEARRAALRAMELFLLDTDSAGIVERDALGRELLARFPSGDRPTDRLLAELIAHLAPFGAAPALLRALEDDPSRAEQIHFGYALRTIATGWDGDTLGRYGRWLEGTRSWSGGYSFDGYLDAIRRDASALFPPPERESLARASPASRPVPPRLSRPAEPLDFDRTLLFLQRTADAKRRSPSEGALVFRAACAACHRVGDEGRGGVGPDLAGATSRFSLRDALEETLRPSRRIADLYRAVDLVTRDGHALTGALVADEGDRVVLLQRDGERAEIAAREIVERRPSSVSLMPDGLLDAFTLEETADLFAYLGSPAPAPDASRWTPLFDGKTLDGWDGDPALWTVENGAIVGTAGGLPASSFLVSRRAFGDFVLELDCRIEEGNSGVQFRSARGERFALRGYQADLGESYWGSLYEEGGRGTLAQPASEIRLALVDEKGWNHLVVSAIGGRIRIELNGSTTVDLRDEGSASGAIGLQLHAGGETRVRFRNLRVRTADLPPDGDP